MILGIGTDIIQIPRIEKLVEKYKDSLAERILSEAEIDLYYQKPIADRGAFLAKRFSAKEAISKAFGVGIGEHLGFKDITISNDNSGKPEAKVVRSIAQDKQIYISISDDYPIAVAFAVISK